MNVISSTLNEVRPDAGESQQFWRDIWGKDVLHNENAEWLKELKKERVDVRQEDIVIIAAFFAENDALLVEQKGCRRKSSGTNDQLLIDKTVLADCKRKHKNLAMAWVDYNKAYDMVPHSWIIESLKWHR